MPRQSLCPRCDARAGIAIEYGLPDQDLIERARRGEVIIGGDVVVDDQPDWHCRACGHEWAAEATPGGLRTVPAGDLTPAEYDAAVRSLAERTRRTSAVCEVLLDSPGGYDTASSRSAYAALLRWIAERHPADSFLETDAGMDDLDIPADQARTADILMAANDVCAALSLLFTANDHGMGRTPTDVTRGLETYTRRRDAPSTDDEPPGMDDDTFLALLEMARSVADFQREPDDGWALVSVAAERVFDVWMSGSDRVWARYAWGALGRAGMTGCGTEVERARVMVRLLALGALYQEFCARAFDVGQPGDWQVDAGRVGVDPFVLGMLAERDGVTSDREIDPGSAAGSVAESALRELVRCEAGSVSDALVKDPGRAALFASMWASPQDDVRYPLPDDAVSAAVNTGVSEGKLYAWQWIDDGMSLG